MSEKPLTHSDRLKSQLDRARALLDALRESAAPNQIPTLDALRAALDALASAHDRAGREADALRAFNAEMLQHFCHDALHPLSFFKGYAGLLRDGTLGPVTAEQIEAADIMSEKAGVVREIVEAYAALLSTSVGQVDLGLRAVALADVVAQVRAEVARQNRKSPPDLVFDIPGDLPALRANPVHLAQVIAALVTNAARHIPDAATITVRAARDAGEVSITVSPGVTDTENRAARSRHMLAEAFVRLMGGAFEAGGEVVGPIRLTLPVEPEA